MAVPAWARSAGVMAAGRDGPCAVELRAAARRAPKVLRRSCQPGMDECLADACARSAGAPSFSCSLPRVSSRGTPRRKARGALRAPLKT
jgi:hypothetical protein